MFRNNWTWHQKGKRLTEASIPFFTAGRKRKKSCEAFSLEIAQVALDWNFRNPSPLFSSLILLIRSTLTIPKRKWKIESHVRFVHYRWSGQTSALWSRIKIGKACCFWQFTPYTLVVLDMCTMLSRETQSSGRHPSHIRARGLLLCVKRVADEMGNGVRYPTIAFSHKTTGVLGFLKWLTLTA